MKLKKIVFMALLLVITSVANAATEGVHNVTINAMSTHNGGENSKIYLKMSNGDVVYINPGQKALHSMALSAFMAGKPVTLWRYTDVSGSYWLGGGVLGSGTASVKRLHRIDVGK